MIRMVLGMAAVVALATSGVAYAQEASFCGGSIVVDHFYSTAKTSGNTWQVDYFAQIRNTTNGAIHAGVSFNVPAAKPTVSPSRDTAFEMNKYASTARKLGTQIIQNPSGAGKLDVAMVKAGTNILCSVPRR